MPVPLLFFEYLQLVEFTGKVIRPDKRGAISIQRLPILERLTISHPEWLINATQFEEHYRKKFARKRRRLDNG